MNHAFALEVRSALALLTRLPVAPKRADRTGSAAFAVVGAGLGIVAGSVTIPLGEERLLAAALALVVLAVVTGALHLDGVADTADALAAADSSLAERARRDPAIGAAGAVAVCFVLLVDAAALAPIRSGPLLPELVIAGTISRAVPALAAPWVRAGEGGFGAWFVAHSGRGGSVLALGTSLAVALFVAEFITPGPRPVIGWLAGLAAGSGVLWLVGRRQGAVTGDGFGASIEIAFAAALVGQAIV